MESTRSEDAFASDSLYPNTSGQQGQQKQQPASITTLEQAQGLLRELELHQTELLVQNQQLRAAQAELETSRYRYACLYELAPVAYFTLDGRGLITECNLAAAKLLGYEQKWLLGYGLLKFVTKSDQAAFFGFFRAVRDREEKGACQVWVLSKEGESKYLRLEGSRLERATGEAEYLLAAMDLTAEQQARAQLQTRQNQFEALVENIPDVVTRWDRDLKMVFANPAFETKTGVRNATLYGKNNLEMGQPEEIAGAWMESLRSVFRTGESVEHYNSFPTPGGEAHFFSRMVPEKNATGEVETVLAIARDITELKKAGQALKQKQELLEATMNSSLDMIQVFEAVRDESGRVVDFRWILNNHASEKRYGDVVGKSLLALNPGVVEEGIFDTFKKVVETGLPNVAERYYVHEQFNGWFLQSVVKLGDGVATTTADITEGKLAGQELLRLKEELAQKATHKYNELFQSIDQGFCTIALKYDANDKPVDYQLLEASPSFEYHTGIKNAAGKRMREIVSDHDELWLETCGRVAKDRKGERFEYFSTPLGRWWSVYAFPIEDPALRQIGVLLDDITGRKRAEERQAFLLKLSDALRPLSNPEEVQFEAVSLLGKQLGVGRAFYCEIEPDGDSMSIRRNYLNGVESQEGFFRISDFGPFLVREYLAGRTVVIGDAGSDPRLTEAERAMYPTINVRAFVCVPLVKGGRLLSVLAVNEPTPRQWTAAQLEMIEETAERTWAAVERARAEEALRKSEEQFRRAIQEAPIPVIMHAENGEVLQISRTWTELTGYTPEEVPTFDAWLTEAYGEGANDVRRHMQALFEGRGRTLNIDFPVRTRQGGLRHWSFSASTPGTLYDGRRFIVGMALDITERKQAETQLKAFNQRLERQVAERTQALQESRDLLQSVFDTSLVGLSVMEAVRDDNGAIGDFRIRMTNKELQRAAGRGDLVGKLFAEQYPGARQAGLFERMLRVMDTGKPESMEYYYPHEGFDHWFSSMFVRLGDGLVATSLNITERKRAEQQLLDMRLGQQQELLNAILEAQEEERRRISESLHNGVGQILYATKLNLVGVNLDALPARKAEVEASLRKTDALLTEAIVETRRVSHELVPVLLKDFGLQKAIKEFCGRFARTGIQMECHCFPNRLPVPLETAIYRMAQELVNNIIKHSGASRARLEVSRDKDIVYLEAQDNGKGMGRETQRGQKSGKGIGMSTIADRVKLLGGSVEIDSTPGNGTLVTISLPLSKGT